MMKYGDIRLLPDSDDIFSEKIYLQKHTDKQCIFAVYKTFYLKVLFLTLAKYSTLQFYTTFVSLSLQGAGVAICVCAS